MQKHKFLEPTTPETIQKHKFLILRRLKRYKNYIKNIGFSSLRRCQIELGTIWQNPAPLLQRDPAKWSQIRTHCGSLLQRFTL